MHAVVCDMRCSSRVSESDLLFMLRQVFDEVRGARFPLLIGIETDSKTI